MSNNTQSHSLKNKKYPAYKPTGIEWLGDIPDRWQIKRLKFVALSNTSSLTENTPEEFRFKYLDIGNVGTGFIIAEPEEMEFDNAPSRARRIVTQHDTIISTVRTYLKAIYYFEENPHDIIVSTGFAVIRPGNALHSKYFYYLSLSVSFIDSIVSNSYGVSYPAINESFLMTLPVWYPKYDEQKQIVEFLDRKTALIDDVVAKKQRLIKLLKEKRQALITHAVTKGLDSNAKLKPSGIDWLGDIPEGWEVKALKYSAIVTMGQSPDSDDYEHKENGLPFLQGNAEFTTMYPTARLWCQTANKRCRKDDILLSVRAPVGAINIADQEYGIGRGLCAICGTAYHQPFLTYLLKASNEHLNVLATGSTFTAVSVDDVKSLGLALPSYTEQEVITDFLDRNTEKIDDIVSKVKSQVWKLREYRQTLITNAVTGKIKIT